MASLVDVDIALWRSLYLSFYSRRIETSVERSRGLLRASLASDGTPKSPGGSPQLRGVPHIQNHGNHARLTLRLLLVEPRFYMVRPDHRVFTGYRR